MTRRCITIFDEEAAHYHRRSNVETVFSMVSARFGGTVMQRKPVAQVNEVLAKALAHNLCCVVKAIFTARIAPRFWPDAPVTPPAQPQVLAPLVPTRAFTSAAIRPEQAVQRDRRCAAIATRRVRRCCVRREGSVAFRPAIEVATPSETAMAASFGTHRTAAS